MRSKQRSLLSMRPVQMIPNVSLHAEGSVQVEFGNTHVRVTCSVEERVPAHMLGTGLGWVTAEYGMLPRATQERMQREAAKGKQSGRTLEIQRLIGRSLRACIDLKALGSRTLTLDCDVIQADGGTRTASITGAYVALVLAMRKMKGDGRLLSMPKLVPLAAVSVGICKGHTVVDLDYAEDSTAEVDMNLVALEGRKLVEIQGTAEKGSFSQDKLNEMLEAGFGAVEELIQIQKKVLGG
ncbi:MAG: ribonuclease PH [Proteobacteria bacterium]|nr:ribonuclease PH [Cystobacterineae bacterium]MCL2259627.1 ribonuclease PH [Cystobacterineae bacterium]MCL2313791.1 ribonuclease PH [Pseudomonadota bacterium]